MKLTKEVLAEAIQLNGSMAEAADALGVPFGTFKYNAVKHGLYEPNQSGKGRQYPKRGDSARFDLDAIISGKVEYKAPPNLLKKRLIAAGLVKDVCVECGQLPEWQGKPLTLHLDHIDGNRSNNVLTNLRVLCPNCHTQTPTYCRKK